MIKMYFIIKNTLNKLKEHQTQIDNEIERVNTKMDLIVSEVTELEAKYTNREEKFIQTL